MTGSSLSFIHVHTSYATEWKAYKFVLVRNRHSPIDIQKCNIWLKFYVNCVCALGTMFRDGSSISRMNTRWMWADDLALMKYADRCLYTFIYVSFITYMSYFAYVYDDEIRYHATRGFVFWNKRFEKKLQYITKLINHHIFPLGDGQTKLSIRTVNIYEITYNHTFDIRHCRVWLVHDNR